MAKNAPSAEAVNFVGVPGLYRDRDPRPDPANVVYYGADAGKGDRTEGAGLPATAGWPPAVAIPAGGLPFRNMTDGRAARGPRK